MGPCQRCGLAGPATPLVMLPFAIGVSVFGDSGHPLRRIFLYSSPATCTSLGSHGFTLPPRQSGIAGSRPAGATDHPSSPRLTLPPPFAARTRLGVPSPLTLPTGATSRGRTQSMHHCVPQLSSPRHQPLASRYTPHFTLAQYSTARRRHT